MTLSLRTVLTSFLFCALLGSSAANGDTGTILKLTLGNVGPDLEGVQIGPDFFIRTASDGNAGTTGDQNTAIEYTAFLDPFFADSTGSFSVAGLKRAGNPNVFGSIIVQDFTEGTFDLYSSTNTLLLHGDLTESTLTGVIGSTGTGSIFTTRVGNFTGGSLLSFPLVHNSLNLSMALTNVNGGSGFVLSGSPSALQPFTTDATVSISATGGPGVPEPASIAIALLGAVGFGFIRLRRA